MMISGALLAIALWAQPGCAQSGYPLDADFSSPLSLHRFVQAVEAPTGATPQQAEISPCVEHHDDLSGDITWLRLQLVSGGVSNQPLLLQIPSRAVPSLCVHWPQRTGFVSQCVGQSQRVDARRFYDFAVPTSMQWSRPVLIEVRDALFAPAPITLIGEAAAQRREQHTMLLSGLFVGLMSSVAVICVLAFAVVKRAGYLYAAGFILLTCLSWVGLSGRGLALPGAVGFWLSRAGPLIAVQLGWLGGLAYIHGYLRLRNDESGWLHGAVVGLIGLHVAVLLWAAVSPPGALSVIALLTLFSVCSLTLLLVWKVLQGSARAAYLLAAFILLMVGVGAAAGGWLGDWQPALKYGSNLVVAGLLVCPAVLLLGIYRRYGRLEEQRDKAEHELASQQRLALMRASFCSVTGLPRGPKIAELTTTMLEEADPENTRIGMYLLQAEKLGQIRQQYGREALEEVINVLCARLRDGLADDQLLGRLENWELVVVVPAQAAGTAFRERLYQAARSISDCMRAPIKVGEQTFKLSISVGMAIWPLHGRGFDDLMLRCDSALYEAERGGGNAFKVFSEEEHRRRANQFQRVSDLKRALEQNELELHYQPVHNALTGEVSSMEALIRWNHPEFGLLLPGSFIPLAEDSDLILDLGYWTLYAAANDLGWLAANGIDLPIAVNVSPRQFASRGFVGHIRETIHHNTFAAHLLHLEITEHSLVDNWEKTSFALTELSNLGVQVFVDDFGVGYSSLNYVRNLPVAGLKIDLSFVQKLGKTAQDDAVVSTILQLARSLNLTVIAEGVETSYQRDFLRIEGCENLQGFLFSKPLPRSQLLDYVHSVEVHPKKVPA